MKILNERLQMFAMFAEFPTDKLYHILTEKSKVLYLAVVNFAINAILSSSSLERDLSPEKKIFCNITVTLKPSSVL